MKQQSTPRVLLLTNAKIHPYLAGGAILTSLFGKFPRDRLFCVHADSGNAAADYRQHRLDSKALRPALVPLLRLLWELLTQTAKAPASFTTRDWKHLLVQACRFHLPRRVRAEIHAFSPDVIYAWTGDSLWLRLLEECVRRYRIPYVIHFMDNHMELRGETAIERAVYREFQRAMPKAVPGAARMFTISDAMGRAYAKKFGKAFEVYHGLLDASQWPWPETSASNDVFTLVFTGSIESGQVNGLRDVAAAVDRLAARGHSVRLLLYVSEHYERRVRRHFENFAHVHFVRHPELPALRGVLTQADLLVLAYGFDQACIEYYRYSFATKSVPYMLSGRCILAYGPATIEPIAYLERGGWAHIVSEQGEALDDAIVRLMKDPRERERLARAAHSEARVAHDLEINSLRFLTSLSEAAGASDGAASAKPACLEESATNRVREIRL